MREGLLPVLQRVERRAENQGQENNTTPASFPAARQCATVEKAEAALSLPGMVSASKCDKASEFAADPSESASAQGEIQSPLGRAGYRAPSSLLAASAGNCAAKSGDLLPVRLRGGFLRIAPHWQQAVADALEGMAARARG